MSAESITSQLEEVLASYLAADPPAREVMRHDLLRRYPQLADELHAFFVDHDRMCHATAPVRQMLTATRRSGPGGGEALPTAGLRVGAYEILEELGRGGMGVVYKARHAELGRVVALKMIRAGQFASAGEARRLRAEAEAVAALDHPHVVPLYEVGEYDGQPYFTMKLVEGRTLAEDSRSVADAAALVATLARAVHHAHERGILHRDLKPANVLIDVEGRPFLTDFGLARRLGGTAMTQPGVAVGTPSYLAPEQATGESRAVTTAADVYGLGAILYELLTGRPPFQGDTSLDVLRQVVEDEPVSPRAVNPAVPRDLETACLKCLEKEPGRRYARALDLAADLDAWRGGEPIRARPMGTGERVVRWCRRQPVFAGLVLALAASLVAGFAATFAQWRRAERHLAEEEASFRLAHRAVNEFGGLLDEELKDVPGMQPARRRSLELTRAYLEEFLGRRRDDPRLPGELAAARLRLAEVLGELAPNAAARDEARTALGMLDDLLQANPADLPLLRQQAAAHALLARLAAQQGDATAALAGYRRAADLYAALDPDDVEVRAGLARVRNNVGSLHQDAGRRKEAVAEWTQARADYERLRKQHPGRVAFRLGLAHVWHNLAVVHADDGAAAEAVAAIRASIAIQRDLVKEYPQSLDFRHGLGVALHHLAVYLGTTGQKAEARKAQQEAHDLRERLARENATVVAYQVALAASLMREGVQHGDAGRPTEALASYRRATAILQEQARLDPSRVQTRLDLVRSLFSTALELGRSKQRPQAIEAYQAARDAAAQLVRMAPERLEGREQLVLTLNNLGLLFGEDRRHADARAAVRQAVAEARRLTAAAPTTERFRRQLGGTLSALGKVERDAGDLPAAVAAIQERLTVWPSNPQELVITAAEFARTAAAAGEEEQHVRYLGLSLAALRKAFAAGYKDFARLRRATDLAGLRRHPGFEELLREFERPR